jgi:Sec-independent protein secretion pathway component TatC
MNLRSFSPAGLFASGRRVSASGGLRASGLFYLGYAYVYFYPPMAGDSQP